MPPIYLRHPTSSDESELLTLKRASRAHLTPWEPTNPSTFTKSWFTRFLANCNTDRHQRFLICLRATNQILGQVSLGEICRGSFQSCFLGYWIAAPFARQGYMTAAVQLALRHAFTKLKLHRVEANIIPRNTASKALAKKCGMRYEGTAKRYLKIAGKWQDHEHWAITKEEWRKQA